MTNDGLGKAQIVGAACAVAAAGLGLFYMSAAGAPVRYLGINIGAVALGFATVALLSRIGARASHGYAMPAAGAALLATALFGIPVEGATRWVGFGPLTVQVSLVLLPAMIVSFARTRDAASATGMGFAALALALQPDRAMAGAMAAALLVVAIARPDRPSVGALAAAAGAFAATLVRPDALPAVPYVDGIFRSAFAVHVPAGAAVAGGALLLLVPAVVGFASIREHRLVHAAFGATWAAVIAAAAVGNYPTPVVGYGGSAILGYLLSLSFLPGSARSAVRAEAPRPSVDGRGGGRPDPRVRAAASV